jgi:phosphoglycolate phosphatase-like HAD superfamily hydrolase|tara:strand:+ start:212 stop:649 length:438 start_codon:yes stop_codon:yes gene_type:complete
MMDVIFDVDGTLMDIEHRRHFVVQRPKDFDAFREATSQDTAKEDIFAVAKALKAAGHRIIISSGRNKSQRAVTLKQLMAQGLVFDALYMRSDSDYRPDHEVKSQMLDKMRKEGFNPTMAFDDRQQVVDMWRERGLTVAQVDKGDF